MNQDESVTGWFRALRDGNDDAATQLWHRYFDRVVRLARTKLTPDAAYDEEDLALSVLGALYSAAKDGRYVDEVADRDELWALLLVLSKRKMIDRSRRKNAKRRLGVKPAAGGSVNTQIEDLRDSHEASTAVEDECQHLLKLLGDSTLQDIALLKLDGQSIPQIAKELEIGMRTVSRKLLLIRKIWQEQLELGEE